MSIKSATFLTLCLALIMVTAHAGLLARDPTCAPLVANVHSCSDALRSGNAAAITPHCCEGLKAIEAAEATLGVSATCRCILQCLRAHFPDVLKTIMQSLTRLALETDVNNGSGITNVMKSRCNVELTCL